jgi:hypothetical protein
MDELLQLLLARALQSNVSMPYGQGQAEAKSFGFPSQEEMDLERMINGAIEGSYKGEAGMTKNLRAPNHHPQAFNPRIPDNRPPMLQGTIASPLDMLIALNGR